MNSDGSSGELNGETGLGPGRPRFSVIRADIWNAREMPHTVSGLWSETRDWPISAGSNIMVRGVGQETPTVAR